MSQRLRQAELLLAGFVLFGALAWLMATESTLTGRATTSTRVNISQAVPRNCSVSVLAGRNTVSFPCILAGTELQEVVNNTGLTAMYQYIPGAADRWKVYNPNLPSYVVSDLRFLTRTAGYVMVMSAPRTYDIEGYEVFVSSVPIVQGWGLVGYPSFTTRNASDAFATINNFTEARTYDNPSGTYLSYINPAGGSLALVQPGTGYWINGTRGTTWMVHS